MKQQKKRMLSVKVTEEEFRKVEEAARKAGYESNSAYVRDCLRTRDRRSLREKDRRQLVTLICTLQSRINLDEIKDADLEKLIDDLKGGLKKWR